MASFLITATIYVTAEHTNSIELEADSAEEAGQKFESLIASKQNFPLDLSSSADSPMIEGLYSVTAVGENMSDEDLMDEPPEIESIPFTLKT